MAHTRAAAVCFALALALSVSSACSRKPATSAVPVSQPAAAAAPGGQPEGETVSGAVLETMNAATYTYIRVKTDRGELWAASNQFPIAVGDRVSFALETPMANFHSQTLNRDFPLIYFVTRVTREGETPPPPMAVGHAPMTGGTPSGPPPQVTEPIPPPPGGLTIAAVWAQRKALVGKTVTVTGKVVKYNGGILDRNWLHIQDGTGNAKDGSNDLAITTSAPAKLGDVITATGKVSINMDFGAGYRYAVMIEAATLTVK